MIDDFAKALFGGPLKSLAAAIDQHGLVVLVILIVVVVFAYVPKVYSQCDVWASLLITPLAKWLKFRFLVLAATKYDVRGHVNTSVAKMTKELPAGWVKPLEIKWVNNETREQFFENNKIVVRVRPLQDQNLNFVTVMHLFLKDALFDKVRVIIPELQRTAAVLYFGDRISTARGEATSRAFNDRIFEPAIEGKKKILEYFQRYGDLDGKGFFSGPYVREIQHVAAEVRATRHRDNMSAEMNQALTHLEDFCKAYEESRKTGTPMQSGAWRRSGIMTKYALLLVANPNKAMVDEAGDGYVSRAQKNHREGVRRLYVVGSTGQRDFAKKVIRAIQKRTEYVLEEEFDLYRDYRGNPGGVGALFCAKDGTC